MGAQDAKEPGGSALQSGDQSNKGNKLFALKKKLNKISPFKSLVLIPRTRDLELVS